MLIPPLTLRDQYGVNPTGILHIGASEGEEADDYEATWPGVPVTWIEARVQAAGKCRANVARYPHHHVICAAVDEQAGRHLRINVASNGQSSSLLELGTHRQHHAEVSYIGSQSVITTTVDDLVAEHGITADMWNSDLQGAELRALRGAVGLLPSIRWAYCEVATSEVYIGNPLVGEVDAFLAGFGFEPFATEMTRFEWGDRAYRKSDKENR